MLKEARTAAGLSRERAAERLYIGTRTLLNYETERTAIPPEIVLRMARVYRNPTLAIRYCAGKCPIGQIFHPRVREQATLPCLVLTLIREGEKLHDIRTTLLNIAADGEITEDEMPMFRQALGELLKLEECIEDLKVWAIKKLPAMQAESLIKLS